MSRRISVSVFFVFSLIIFGGGFMAQASADIVVPTCGVGENSHQDFCNPPGTVRCNLLHQTQSECEAAQRPAFDFVRYGLNTLIEATLGVIILALFRRSLRLVLAVIVVNLISWPILFFVLTHHPGLNFLIGGEALVWVFEAVGIYALSRLSKLSRLSLRQAVLLSALTNAATIALSVGYAQLNQLS